MTEVCAASFCTRNVHGNHAKRQRSTHCGCQADMEAGESQKDINDEEPQLQAVS